MKIMIVAEGQVLTAEIIFQLRAEIEGKTGETDVEFVQKLRVHVPPVMVTIEIKEEPPYERSRPPKPDRAEQRRMNKEISRRTRR